MIILLRPTGEPFHVQILAKQMFCSNSSLQWRASIVPVFHQVSQPNFRRCLINNQRMDFSFIIITNTVLANVKYKAHNNYNYVFTILLTKQVINLLLPTCPDLMRRHSSGREQSGSVSVALFLLQCSPHLTLLQSSKVEKVNVGHKHQGYSRGAGVEWVLTSRSVSS